MSHQSKWITALEAIIPLLGGIVYPTMSLSVASLSARPGPAEEGEDAPVELIVILDVELDVILDDETSHVLVLFTWSKKASSGITVHSDCQPSDEIMEHLVELGRQVQLGLDSLPESLMPLGCLP